MAIATAADGRDVAGFDVPETVRLKPEETELRLNGAHVRSSFLRPVTLFALYTFAPAAGFEALVADGKPKRVAVTILRPEFSAERFRSGWQEQFAQALAEDERLALREEIAAFVETFETLRRGEQLHFDFVPVEGVRFHVRRSLKRTIPGDAFARALLGVWLGPRSVDTELRRALLGSGAQ